MLMVVAAARGSDAKTAAGAGRKDVGTVAPAATQTSALHAGSYVIPLEIMMMVLVR